MSNAIVINRFGGEAPRVSKELLPDGYAQYALNSKLSSGDLTPYRLPLYLLNETVTNTETIYPMMADSGDYFWMMWATDVDVAKSVTANNITQRVYYTGDGVPKATDINRATFQTTLTKVANYTQLVGDYEKTVKFTTSGTTYSLLAAATAKNQFVVLVYNAAATGNVTIDPNGAELIDGAATITVAPGVRRLIRCNGTAWTSTIVTSYPYDWFSLGIAAPVTAPTVAYDILAKSGAYTALIGDLGKTLDASSTPWTLTLDNAATLTSAWLLVVRNLGTGLLTIATSGSELINNAASVTMTSGQIAVISTNGTSFGATVITSGFTAWVYTYVTEWGEESAPSPASSLFLHVSGQRMLLSALPATPPVGATNVRTIRIYRTNTGTTGTFYQLVEEKNIGTTTYTDFVTNSSLGEQLPSTFWVPPPSDLKGLVTMANGIMAGFHNNEVCFSEPYKPYAWPESYRYSVDSTIVAIGSLANTLVITTTGRPYLATGNHPAGMSIVPINQPYPCTSKRGLVNMGTGILYPTFEGMVYATTAAPTVATAQLFTRDEWRLLEPTTMLGVFYDGKYFGNFTDVDGNAGSFIFQYTSDRVPLFVRTNISASAGFSDMTTGAYFFLREGRLYQWDEYNMPYSTMDWWSKEFELDKPCNFGVAKLEGIFEAQDLSVLLAEIIELNGIIGDPLGEIDVFELDTLEINGDLYADLSSTYTGAIFTLYVDGEYKWSRAVQSNRAFRLPRGFKSDRMSFRVSANIVIHAVLVAETPYALERISGS